MYDVTDRNTFVKLETWLNELNTYCNKTDIIKMVVGNKIDLPNREVSTEEGLQFARRHQTLYIESSAKTADGVKCCFEELVQKVYLNLHQQLLYKVNYNYNIISLLIFHDIILRSIDNTNAWSLGHSLSQIVRQRYHGCEASNWKEGNAVGQQ